MTRPAGCLPSPNCGRLGLVLPHDCFRDTGGPGRASASATSRSRRSPAARYSFATDRSVRSDLSARSPSRGRTRTTAPAATEVAATGRTIPRARALRRKAGVRISAVPSSSSLALSPRSKRARPRLGTTAFVPGPAWASLSQRRPGSRAPTPPPDKRFATIGIARSRGRRTTPAVTTSIRSAAPTMPSRRCSAPNALSQGGELALKPQRRASATRSWAGGFTRVRRAAETPVNLVLEPRP
jgi:hypothetical protein